VIKATADKWGHKYKFFTQNGLKFSKKSCIFPKIGVFQKKSSLFILKVLDAAFP